MSTAHLGLTLTVQTLDGRVIAGQVTHENVTTITIGGIPLRKCAITRILSPTA